MIREDKKSRHNAFNPCMSHASVTRRDHARAHVVCVLCAANPSRDNRICPTGRSKRPRKNQHEKDRRSS
eukprot:scaffold264494_cov27-Tisochrysis_lutea.AAC.8